MTSLKISTDPSSPWYGDIDLTTGSIQLTDDVAQEPFIRVRWFKGEWFLDITFGTPYFQLIFQKGATKETVDAAFKAQILASEKITAIRNYVSTFDGKKRKYTFTCNAVFSDGTTQNISNGLTI